MQKISKVNQTYVKFNDYLVKLLANSDDLD